jgi:hypothetical protein
MKNLVDNLKGQRYPPSRANFCTTIVEHLDTRISFRISHCMLTQSYFFSAGLSDRISSNGRGVENASCKKPSNYVRIPLPSCNNHLPRSISISMQMSVVHVHLQGWLACNSVFYHSWGPREGSFTSSFHSERMWLRSTPVFQTYKCKGQLLWDQHLRSCPYIITQKDYFLPNILRYLFTHKWDLRTCLLTYASSFSHVREVFPETRLKRADGHVSSVKLTSYAVLQNPSPTRAHTHFIFSQSQTTK